MLKSYKLFVATLLLVFSAYALAEQAMVNINTASPEMLASHLHGIGPAKAAAIVEYREQHGAFKSVSDLVNVRGIGMSLLEKNKKHITVEMSDSK